MHISATTANDHIIRAPRFCRTPAFCSLDLTSVAIKALARAEAEGYRAGLDSLLRIEIRRRLFACRRHTKPIV